MLKGFNMSRNSYDYSARKGVQPISWEDFHGICKALAVSVSHFHPEAIVPIGRGGYYPGALLAHLLQAEIYPVRVSRRINDIVKYKEPYSFAASIILSNSVSKHVTFFVYHNSGKHTIFESDNPTFFSILRICSTAFALLLCKCT